MERIAPFQRGSQWKPFSGSSRRGIGNGVGFFSVAHEFTEYDPEMEPEASSARGGGPPRKHAGIGMLDPPFHPKRPPGSIPTVPSSLLFRIFAGLILLGLASAILLLLFGQH